MNICKGCGFAVTHRQHVAQCVQGVTPAVTEPVGVTSSVTNVTPAVTHKREVQDLDIRPVTPVGAPSRYRVVASRAEYDALTDGRHACPTCGEVHGRARTDAERALAYRERRRAT